MERIIRGKRNLRGEIEVPGDESISHRAVILGSIASGTSEIWGLSTSMDVRRTIGAMKKIGVSIVEKEGETHIGGRGITGLLQKKQQGPLEIECGNSETTARLLIGLLCGAGFNVRLSGNASLSKCPMNSVVEPMKKIGAHISSNNGFLPVEISGKRLFPFRYELPAASAEVKTAFVLAALLIPGNSVLIERQETRDHTERLLRAMDGELMEMNLIHGKNIFISGRKELSPLETRIPGDISSAAFFIAAALVSHRSEITMKNILVKRARFHIIEVFKRMGADIEVDIIDEFPEPLGNIRVKSSVLRGTTIGGVEIPLIIDEIPALASAACFAKGKTTVRGASELRLRGSDRIKGIVDMVRGFGGEIEEHDDGFTLTGKKGLQPGVIENCEDNLLAMAASIIGNSIKGETRIKNAQCVDVSFPGYFELFERVTSSTQRQKKSHRKT
jgi:3-phosphoshikimate 1-carboxyvinyltransferase